MRNIARLSDNDRRELFRNTADKMGLNDAIVEKDFWVCFTLDYLFHRSPWKESITFKGGTSLSKAFHLISRFSEDIDLILDWRVLGYGKDEPWEKRSNTKQDAFNKEANVRAEVFLSETFCPAVKAGLSQEIGCEANVYIDEKDKQTVIFAYPHLFTNTATLQVIRLEIGALAAWTPAKTALIEPYAAKYYPKIFEQKETAILTVAPERTFWEKATILHHEANRPEHLESSVSILSTETRLSQHQAVVCLFHMMKKQLKKQNSLLHRQESRRFITSIRKSVTTTVCPTSQQVSDADSSIIWTRTFP